MNVSLSFKFLLLIAFFSMESVLAQGFQGKITYQGIYSDPAMEEKLKDPKVNLEKRAQYEQQQEMIKAMSERPYILEFTQGESTYREDPNLLVPESNYEALGPNREIFYKNVAKGIYIRKSDFTGKRFLVTDSIKKYPWIITAETKKIGKYTCYKAYFTENRLIGSKAVESEDGGFETVMMYDDLTTTAWFTTEIPISNGPRAYGGLPGMILELHGGMWVAWRASEIVLNPSNPIKIKPPTGGKVVSEKEYIEKR